MSRWAVLSLLVVSMGMIACGGDEQTQAPIVVFIPMEDPPPPPCDALTNEGCEAGEKCTFVYVDPEQAFGRSACVPDDGMLEIGDDCELSALGVADGCRAGSMCLRGKCTEICSVDPDDLSECSPGTVCGRFSSIFNDQVNENIGLCSPTCNAVFQSCEDPEQGCFLLDTTGLASCTRVPQEASTRFQDDECYGPGAGLCYRNGCARGFDTWGTGLCMQFCQPMESGIGALEGIRGNPEGITCGEYNPDATPEEIAMTECRFYNAIAQQQPGMLTPPSLGICMTQAVREANSLGSCATHDLNAPFTQENVNNGTYVRGCEPSTDQARAGEPFRQKMERERIELYYTLQGSDSAP